MSAEPQTDRRVLTDEEAWDLFDKRSRELVGMSGEEFVRRFDAGEFAGRDEPGIIDVYMLMPLARRRDASTNPR